MIKRIVCSLAAVMVLTSSVFAWDAYSFTGVYDIASASAPVLYASSDSSPVENFLTFSSGSFIPAMHGSYIYDLGIPGTTPIPSIWTDSQTFTLNPSEANLPGGNQFGYWGLSFTPDAFSKYASDITTYYQPQSLQFDYVLSADSGSALGISLSVSVYSDAQIKYDGSTEMPLSRPTKLELQLDGSTFYTVTNNSGSFVVDYIHPSISSSGTLSLLFSEWTVSSFSFSDLSYQDPEPSLFPLNIFVDQFELSSLSGDSVLDGFVDEAQGDITDHETIESQWTGSMSSNFDALDMDNFTFPSGLVSGFGLITGIFQDLWNGMGEYKILYVFPLTLGVALLLIGRISKFSGGQSSSRSDRGNDDA